MYEAALAGMKDVTFTVYNDLQGFIDRSPLLFTLLKIIGNGSKLHYTTLPQNINSWYISIVYQKL